MNELQRKHKPWLRSTAFKYITVAHMDDAERER